MKFVLPTVTLVLLSALTAVKGDNPISCLESVDYDVDYFPDKVAPMDSVFWSIEYANTYKILTNKFVNETYLLYQCGSEPPADQLDGRHTEVVQIPLLEAGVAITQTPMISYLEQLGLMTEIKVFISNPDTISSPCLKKRVDDGEVLVVADAYSVDATTGFASNAASNAEISSTVAFISRFDSFLPFETKIVISESDEGPNAAIFEWVAFFAAFFNKEALASEVIDAANTRFDCIAGNAGLISSDSQDKPVVFWAMYSGYCSGWSLAVCNDGNYYCEYAEACQADIISSVDGSITDGICGSIYFTTEEMFELGKDADHWIYPADNWDETFANNTELLGQMKSVKNEQVFDYLGTSQSGWFEQRLAQYYDVLDDFCTIVGTTSVFDRKREFFRNVFTEPIGVMGQCVDPDASLILNDSTTCIVNKISEDDGSTTVVDITPDGGSSASTVASGKNLFGVGFVLAVASIFA
jgi:iron complex transport system substrate-binding protein